MEWRIVCSPRAPSEVALWYGNLSDNQTDFRSVQSTEKSRLMSSPVIQKCLSGCSPCSPCRRSWSSVQRRRVRRHILSAKPWASSACSFTCLKMNVSHLRENIQKEFSNRPWAVSTPHANTRSSCECCLYGLFLCPPQTTLMASPSSHLLAQTRSRYLTSVPKVQRSCSSFWTTWRSRSRKCRRWSRYVSSVRIQWCFFP